MRLPCIARHQPLGMSRGVLYLRDRVTVVTFSLRRASLPIRDMDGFRTDDQNGNVNSVAPCQLFSTYVTATEHATKLRPWFDQGGQARAFGEVVESAVETIEDSRGSSRLQAPQQPPTTVASHPSHIHLR
jgi:hypothetical protein